MPTIKEYAVHYYRKTAWLAIGNSGGGAKRESRRDPRGSGTGMAQFAVENPNTKAPNPREDPGRM